MYQNVGGGLETSKINLTMLWESGLKLGIHRTTSAAFSPDGEKIAIGTDLGRIILFSSLGGKLWEKDIGKYVDAIAFSPDGREIAVGTKDGRIIALSLWSDRKLWESEDLGGHVVPDSLGFAPDGEKIFLATEAHKITVYSLASSYSHDVVSSVSRDLNKQSVISTPKIIDLSPVEDLLSLPLRGLLPGYGCLGNSFEAKFSLGIFPLGFEGTWTCCKLGCGGWGCAYLCKRGSEYIVVKVPRGYEQIVEISFSRGKPLMERMP